MYILWFDDSKKSTTDKVVGACSAYHERYGVRPDVVLVNEVDLCVVPGIRVECAAHVPRNNFWIGPLVEEGHK